MTNRIALLAALILSPSVAFAASAHAASDGAKQGPAAAAPASAQPAPTANKLESLSAFLSIPLFSDRARDVPVAAIDDEIVTLRELTDAIAAAHEAGVEAAKDGSFTAVLERLIDARLLVLEARDMELDKLPEVKAAIAEFNDRELRATLERHVTREVKPDPMQVEQEYKEAIREWKVRSLLFRAEADAKAFATGLRGGKKFDELARQALEAKKATGVPDADWIAPARLAPKVASAVASLRPGAATDPVAMEGGFTVVQLEDVRYPENPERRAEAEARSVDQRSTVALRELRSGLEKKYAKMDTRLLRSLNFEGRTSAVTALLKDARPLVRIQGEKPITVADLTNALIASFFHGIEEPIKQKRVNNHKEEVLRKLLTKRLFLKEANRLALASTPGYRNAVVEYERGQLVGRLFEKVIIPDVKVTEAEGEAYYQKHQADYTSPAFYKLDGLAFKRSSGASSALKQLQGGTDFSWLRANAEGQVPQDQRTLQIDGSTYSASTLAPELVAALSGAGKGDYRLCEASGQYWVLRVLDRIAEEIQPYKAVRKAIVEKLFAEKATEAIKAYAAKLRGVHHVDVYITRIAAEAKEGKSK